MRAACHAALVAVLVAAAPSAALAQDAGRAGDERSGLPRPAGPGVAHPTGPDEIDARIIRGAPLSLPEALRAAGRFGLAMLGISVALVALAIFATLRSRPGLVFPRQLHERTLSRIATGQVAGARASLDGIESLYARAARAALSLPPGASAEELRAAARSCGERDAGVLRRRLASLVHLGVVAVLVGLLGTLVGMQAAFGSAAGEEFLPVLVYAGIFKALVTSIMGVGLAIVAVAAYYALSARLEPALAEAGCALDDLVSTVRHLKPSVNMIEHLEAAGEQVVAGTVPPEERP